MSVLQRSLPSASRAPYQLITQDQSPEPEPMSTRLSMDLEIADPDEQMTADVDEMVVRSISASQDGRIRWIHFVLGCAVLLPWNALITATPFFLSRLADSPLKSTFSSYLSTTFTAANFVFLAYATATSKQSRNARRTMLSMLWLALLAFTLTLSTYFHMNAGLFFVFVILNGIAQAAAGSFLQTSIIAVASLFGPSAMQAVMAGQAGVGVAVSAVQLISSAASVRGASSAEVNSEPEEKAAFIFFGLSTLFLLASAVAHAYLINLPAYKSVVGAFIPRVDNSGDIHEAAVFHETQHLVSQGSDIGNKLNEKSRVLRLAQVNVTYNIAVAYVFVISLAMFPPITISIQSTNPSTHPLLFSAIHFLVFNCGDFLGRYLCSIPRLAVWSAKRLLSLSLARTLFIPIFLMCNIQRTSTTTPIPTLSSVSSALITSDFLFMLIMLLFGLSNGYVSSMCMMSAPSVEHNPRLKGRVEDVDVAATVASFCLVGGLAVGSIASFGVRAAVCDCNPFRG